MFALLIVHRRYHNLLQWLAHFYVHLTPQGQYHRRNLLCQAHAGFQFLVDEALVGLGEPCQMDRANVVALCHCYQVKIQLVGIERSKRGQQPCHGFKASVQSLVSGQLVTAHLLAPETLAVEADKPVGQIVINE